MIQRGQSYYGIAGVAINLATLYTVREAMLKGYMPWINFSIILIFVGLLAVAVIIIDYKIIYPSQIAYHQFEAWKHKSPVRKKMEQDKEDTRLLMARIEEKLDRLLDEKENLNGKR